MAMQGHSHKPQLLLVLGLKNPYTSPSVNPDGRFVGHHFKPWFRRPLEPNGTKSSIATQLVNLSLALTAWYVHFPFDPKLHVTPSPGEIDPPATTEQHVGLAVGCSVLGFRVGVEEVG